jgi:hypothetical protein
MSYTMGADLGFVMAKGVLLGVIGCVTTLPALILLFDKPLEKTAATSALLPRMDGLAGSSPSTMSPSSSLRHSAGSGNLRLTT